MAKTKDPLESSIQKSICDYLALKKHMFWRQNNNPIYSEGRMFKLPKYSMQGIPDIILIKDGFFIGLEVKRPKTKQSPGQLEFERRCKEAGGEYHVVRSIDDVKNIGL
jgi:hypothetical protein